MNCSRKSVKVKQTFVLIHVDGSSHAGVTGVDIFKHSTKLYALQHLMAAIIVKRKSRDKNHNRLRIKPYPYRQLPFFNA